MFPVGLELAAVAAVWARLETVALSWTGLALRAQVGLAEVAA